MKIRPSSASPSCLIAFSYIIIFFTSCQNNSVLTDYKNKKYDSTGKGYTDYEGAMQYEFIMTRDPGTGKIPEGIREAELAEAKQIFDFQSSETGRPTLSNSYFYQGPNNLGGRTRTIAYDVRFNGSSNRIILAGGVSGGVYKSIDDGATWERKSPVEDLFSVTSIVQDPRISFQDTWYYAGGEWTGNSTSEAGATYRGKGIYKSTDNGETWVFMPNSNTGILESFDHRADYISKLVIDPTNGNVYMAALDAICRSTDGGATWSNVLTSGNASYGSGMMSDIVVSSVGTFYASFAGGSNTGPTLDMPGVWKSATGNSGSWTKIAGPTSGTNPAGWNAAGAFGRCVLAIPPSLETSVYAIYTISTGSCSIEAELFRWDDGISAWTELSSFLPDESGCLSGNDPFAVQGGYNLVIAVKPDASNTVFIGGTNIYRSTNGFTSSAATTRIGGYANAASYAQYTNSHPDIHSIVFQPGSSATMLCGNDGGIQRTSNNLAGTVAWTPINSGYRTFQFYNVTPDPRLSNEKVMGGAQDNGSSRNIGGTGSNFEIMFSGDGVSVGLSDLISGVQYEYVGFQNGYIYRRPSTDISGSGTNITPTGEGGTGLFVTLFKLDQDNTSQRLYYANDDTLCRTTSASTVTSATWTKMTGVATAVGAANDISTLATTRGAYNAGTASLFFGTSNGKVFRLDDPTGVAASTAPVDITGGAFPAGAFVSNISVNPRNDDTVMVTFSNYSVVSVFWTGNANASSPTWTAVEGSGAGSLSLPSFRSSAILINGVTGKVEYYVGTSVGLYSAVDLPASISWSIEWSGTIGLAPVNSLALRPADNKLLVGTHGYGMWYTTLPSGTLPVTFKEFKGTLQTNNVLLQWTTASEINNKQFELEKSFDGLHFRRIATLPAAENSGSVRHYSFLDKEPLTEKNYYRLKSVSIDAKSVLSNIILIKVPDVKQDIFVLGNPFRENILVRFTKTPVGKIEFRLVDMNGRVVARQNFSGANQQVVFNTPGNLPRGIYQLQVMSDGTSITSRVIRQ